MAGWCECGAADNDPLHSAWHKLWAWNRDVLASHAARRQAEFDEELAVHDYRHGRRVELPQPALETGRGGREGFRANPDS